MPSVVSNLRAPRVYWPKRPEIARQARALTEETASQVLSHVVRERFGREPDYPENRFTTSGQHGTFSPITSD